MNTMLNSQGRIGPVTFRDAAMILIAIGAILAALPSTIVSVVISLAFVLAGNALLRSDPPNAYDLPHKR